MSTCYAVTSVGVESRSRCHGVTCEVVAMSLAARCKRRSKKADYYCLLLRTEMAGATKGIDKHLLRCDIGRVESTSTCYAVTSVGVESRSRCDGVTSEVVAMSLAARCFFVRCIIFGARIFEEIHAVAVS